MEIIHKENTAKLNRERDRMLRLSMMNFGAMVVQPDFVPGLIPEKSPCLKKSPCFNKIVMN